MIRYALIPAILSLALAPGAQAADTSNQPADTGSTHVAIAFSGETVANKGLFGAVSKYIFDHRPDKSCNSIEAVHTSSLPLAAVNGFPKRTHEDNLRDDVHEIWEVTLCGKQQSNLVRFSFAKDGGIDYWVNAMAPK